MRKVELSVVTVYVNKINPVALRRSKLHRVLAVLSVIGLKNENPLADLNTV